MRIVLAEVKKGHCYYIPTIEFFQEKNGNVQNWHNFDIVKATTVGDYGTFSAVMVEGKDKGLVLYDLSIASCLPMPIEVNEHKFTFDSLDKSWYY